MRILIGNDLEYTVYMHCKKNRLKKRKEKKWNNYFYIISYIYINSPQVHIMHDEL